MTEIFEKNRTKSSGPGQNRTCLPEAGPVSAPPGLPSAPGFRPISWLVGFEVRHGAEPPPVVSAESLLTHFLRSETAFDLLPRTARGGWARPVWAPGPAEPPTLTDLLLVLTYR